MRGHAETVRVLVELGASLEAVDKVHIHTHALSPLPKGTILFFPSLQFYEGSIKALFSGSFKALFRLY